MGPPSFLHGRAGGCRWLVCIALIASCSPPLAAGPSGKAHADRLVPGGGRDSSRSGLGKIDRLGFNAVTVQPTRRDLRALKRTGLKGVVWLFGYDDESCRFEKSRGWVKRRILLIRGSSLVLAYQLADEPNYARVNGCPRVSTQIRKRSRFIHSLDPATPTFVTLSTWDGEQAFSYEHFERSANILGLVVYPCARKSVRCKLADIRRAIREANRDGVSRYWAIIQDFSDSYHRRPRAWEVRNQFRTWADSRLGGYFIYHWQLTNIEGSSRKKKLYSRVNRVFPRLGS